MFQSWFIFVLISVIAISLGEIGQKLSVTSKVSISAKSINFVVSVIQFIFSLLYLIFFVPEFSFSLSLQQLIMLLISGFLSFFFFDALYTSYKGNSVSISQVIFSFSVVLSSILGIVIFNESSELLKFIGIILIITGVVIVTFKKGERISRYNLLALFAAIIYAILTNIDKSFASTINPHVYQVMYTFMFMIASMLIKGREIIKEVKLIDSLIIKSILLSAIAFTISNKLTFLSYANGGEVGRVDAINNSAVLLIIILEVLILKDKSNLKKKVIASVLTVSGIIFLGLIL